MGVHSGGGGSMRARRAVSACLVVAGFVLAGLAVTTSAALAQFPYLGTGNLAEPASWKLAPGEVPDNIGGDAWKYAATPAIAAARLRAARPNMRLSPRTNSQMDELCGVTGMSLVDANATMPSGTGSCIAAGTPIHTAFDETLGRPDVSIAELDSGVEWNNRSAMLLFRCEGPAEPRRATRARRWT